MAVPPLKRTATSEPRESAISLSEKQLGVGFYSDVFDQVSSA
jgi:hypothetical protein